MRITGLILLLAACIFALWLWFNSLSKELKSTTKDYKPQEIDYQIKEFKAVIFNTNGQANQQFQGEVLRHFPFDDHLEIEHPKGQTLLGVNRWKIQSNNAKSTRNLSELHWQGNVNIQQLGQEALSIKTNYLLQQLQQQLASTKQHIIINTASGNIEAQSMQLHTGTSQLTFKGEVNSVYQIQ